MKKFFLFLLIIFIGITGFVLFFLKPRLPILNGYAAKDFCSCYFLANRAPETIHKEDLYFSPVNFAKCEVDEKNKTVTASTFLGIAKRTAVYREGFGCSLANEKSIEEIKQVTFKKPPLPQENPDTIPWPYGNLLPDTLPKNVDYEILSTIMDSSFDKNGAWYKKTRAIVVVHKNQIIAEKYASGIDQNTPLIGWSMTKTITSALVGILVKNKRLKLHEGTNIPSWQEDNRKEITPHHLLQMNSGLDWVEDYGTISNATVMLYQKDNVYDYAIQSKLATPPGNKWYYSSGTTNILSGLIRNQFDSNEEYWRFPYDSLFYPLGMRSITFEPDADGIYVGSSYSFASARDWARFGLLYQNNGYYNGKQVLPTDWTSYSTKEAQGSDGEYGAQLWLNLSQKTLPNCPQEVYYMDGYNGQRVFIVPSKDLVVVRLGVSKSKEEFNFDQFLSRVISTIKTPN